MVININIRGIDRLEFGIDIIDYENKFKPILLELRDKKENGQEIGIAYHIDYNNLLFEVGLKVLDFMPIK